MTPRDWLPPGLAAVRVAVVEAAHSDVGEMELPGNRGAFADACNRASGSPLGSSYCASAAVRWYDRAGARRPASSGGSCDVWRDWALQHGLLLPPESPDVLPGDVVLYTNWKRLPNGRWDVFHAGVVARLTPNRMSVEANTSSVGFEREGKACLLKGVHTPAVVGFVRCVAVGQPLPR